MSLQLHDYQRVAVAHLRAHPKAGLFLDMGLGKTAISFSALTADHLPVLVTAPKRVAENVWEEEGRLWRPDLRVAVAAGSPAKRKAALESGADVIVIGRDNLRDALPYRRRFKTFIMDELSSFKTRGSQRWKAARELTRDMPYVWGLTGTPAPNGLMDLWAQVFLLDKGARLETTLTRYRSRYFYAGRQLPNGVVTEWVVRPESEKAIHAKLEDICLSMTTDGRVHLPPVTYNEVTVPLPADVRRVYKALKDDMVTDLDLLGEEIRITAGTAAALSNKLSQVSAGFSYRQDELGQTIQGQWDVLHKEKVTAAKEIVEGTGAPVLIFYRYKAERAMLLEAMPEARTVDEPGIIKAWSRGEVPVLLAHPASAGHGLNLQHGGYTIVWTSLTWSLEEWEQANKRLARQGQRNPVIIHMLLSPKTVDHVIKQVVHDKKTVQDALIAHLESPL